MKASRKRLRLLEPLRPLKKALSDLGKAGMAFLDLRGASAFCTVMLLIPLIFLVQAISKSEPVANITMGIIAILLLLFINHVWGDTFTEKIQGRLESRGGKPDEDEPSAESPAGGSDDEFGEDREGVHSLPRPKDISSS